MGSALKQIGLFMFGFGVVLGSWVAPVMYQGINIPFLYNLLWVFLISFGSYLIASQN